MPLQIIFLLYPPSQRNWIPGLPVTSQGSFAVKNRGRAFPGFARFARDAMPAPHWNTKPLSYQSKHRYKRLKHINHQQNHLTHWLVLKVHSLRFHWFKLHFIDLYTKNIFHKHTDNPGEFSTQQTVVVSFMQVRKLSNLSQLSEASVRTLLRTW